MNYPIRFICFGGAALALSACSVPDFDYSETLGLQTPQQAAVPAPAPKATPARVAAPAPVAAPTPVAQQQVAEETEEVANTNRWAHRRLGGSANLSDGSSGGLSDSDETGGWGG